MIIKDTTPTFSEMSPPKAEKIPSQFLPPLSKVEKLKAVSGVSSSLNKTYGTQLVQKMGKKPMLRLPSISTNLPTLDEEVIQCGGVPKGRVIEVYGPESSGKTTICLHIIACAQEQGGVAAFVDAEHALDPSYAKKLGVNIDELIISQPDYGEQALEVVLALVEARAVDVLVVDSVSALVPKAELDGDMGDSHMGLQARLMSQAMRKLVGAVHKAGVCVIFINQIREKIGVMFGNPETTTGGRALKFYSSVRLEVRRMSKTDGGNIMENDVMVGHRMRIKNVKNKVGIPFRETDVALRYGVGFDTRADMVEYASHLGVVELGAWCKFDGQQYRKGDLTQDPVYANLVLAVGKAQKDLAAKAIAEDK